MKKIGFLLSLLLALSLVLAACRGNQETETPIATLPGEGFGTATPGLPSTGATAFPTEVLTPTVSLATETTAPVITSTAALSPTLPAVTGTPGVTVPTGVANIGQLSRLMDFHILNTNGDDLGEVNDMIVNLGNQGIDYVVLGAGGFLGIGEKNIPIPWSDLSVGMVGDNSCAFIANVDTQSIQNAPALDLGNVDLNTSGWDTDIVNFWNNLTGTSPVTGTATVTGTTPMTGTTGLANVTNCTLNDTVSKMSTGTTGSVSATSAVTGTATTGGVATTPMATVAGTAAAPSTGPLNQVLLASKMLDFEVLDKNGERVGDVKDALVSLGTGREVNPGSPGSPSATATPSASSSGSSMTTGESIRSGAIQFLLVEVDRALNIGDKWVPVPLNALSMNTTEENQFVLTNMTRDQLEQAPAFDVDTLPDLSTPSWDQNLRDFWVNLTS